MKETPDSTDEKPVNENRDKRRQLLQTLVASGAIAGSALPSQWRKPVVNSVILPAHAQTSGLAFGGPINDGLGLLDRVISPAYAGRSFSDGCIRLDVSSGSVTIKIQDNGDSTFNAITEVKNNKFSTTVGPAEVNGELITDDEGNITHIVGTVEGHGFTATTGEASTCPRAKAKGACESAVLMALLESGPTGALYVRGEHSINGACSKTLYGDYPVAFLIADGVTFDYHTTGDQECSVTETAFIDGCVISSSFNVNSASSSYGVGVGSEITLRFEAPGGCVCSTTATVALDGD